MADRSERDPYFGLKIVGWGPFRFPGEKRRLRKAQQYAEEMARAMRALRERDR